jgi:general secretion pathway protein D
VFKAVLFLLIFVFSSCNRGSVDFDSGLTKKDYYDDFVSKKNIPSSNSFQTSPLNLSKLLVVPPPPPIGNGELISLAITEEVPIRELLNELARKAEIDIELDSNITGGIFLKVTKKPIEFILQRIAEISDLRYTLKDNVLKVEKDLPYTKTYTVDFLIDNEIWASVEGSINEIISIENEKIQLASGVPVDATADSSQQSQGSDSKKSFNGLPTQKVFINKQSSMITIYANSKTQKAIEKYLDIAKQNYSAQVLIEAKVVEITLNDSYKMGVDWSNVMSKGGSFFVDGIHTIEGAKKSIENAVISGQISSGNLNGTISLLSEFGTANTVSSPRISAINNQKANIDFTNKLVYFKITPGTTERDDTGVITSTASTAEKVEEEIGVKLNITPAIDLKNNSITLLVTPEMSVEKGEVLDPSIALAEASCVVNICQGDSKIPGCTDGQIKEKNGLCDLGDANMIPVIEKRTLNTSLKVQSGNVLIIGGLLKEETLTKETGVPFLSSIPLLGILFKSESKEKNITETVIFIKATIVKPNENIKGHNRNLLEKYATNNDDYL